MKKQTAVEWLVSKILTEFELYVNEEGDVIDEPITAYYNSFKSHVNLCIYVAQAKAMEKEQMFELWNGGINCTEEGGKSFDQYYNETYNTDTQ